MLPASHSRFVLVTGVSEAAVTHDRVALEGTKEIRRITGWVFRSFAAHFAFRGQSCRRDRLRRYRSLGEHHHATVRSDAKDREIFMWLC